MIGMIIIIINRDYDDDGDDRDDDDDDDYYDRDYYYYYDDRDDEDDDDYDDGDDRDDDGDDDRDDDDGDDRDDAMVFGDALRQNVDGGRIWCDAVEIGKGDALLLRLSLQHFALADHAEFHENAAKVLLGLLLNLLRLFELLLLQISLLNQELHHGHAR